MGNLPFNVVVVLFWFLTMGWLMVAKIIPPLRLGEPPNYTSILEESDEQPPVCWAIRFHDKTIGWAASKIVRRKDGIADLYNHVYLGAMPWEELAPGFVTAVLKPILDDLGPIDIEKRSRLVIDPLGRPVDFESRLRVAGLVDAIKVQGQIEGSTLKLSVQSGDVVHKLSHKLPPGALVSDELSPQGRMPRLRVGQSWTVPLYSPFRALDSPMEILEAVVDREDSIYWDGKTHKSRMITYRADAGSGLAGKETRGRVWVRDDGVVLRQDVAILKTHLQFVRLTDRQAENIWRSLGEEWNVVLPRALARGLLEQLAAETL